MAWLRGVCEGLRRWALAGRLGKHRGLAGKRLRRWALAGRLGKRRGSTEERLRGACEGLRRLGKTPGINRGTPACAGAPPCWRRSWT